MDEITGKTKPGKLNLARLLQNLMTVETAQRDIHRNPFVHGPWCPANARIPQSAAMTRSDDQGLVQSISQSLETI